MVFAELQAGRRVLLEWPLADGEVVDVVVLDSAVRLQVAGCAAMVVPRGREAEWVFSSESGQWQLLASSGAARLVLVTRRSTRAQVPDNELKLQVTPLVTALAPRACFAQGPPVVPFLCYEDNVACRKVVERAWSPLTGDLLVEDVRLHEEHDRLRRRLVFKRTPNLIQTEVLLRAQQQAGEAAAQVDHGQLVHVYLAPLIAGLYLLVTSGKVPPPPPPLRVVCVGIGGGALPMFLSSQLGDAVRVEAVDLDEVVLGLASRHFGLAGAANSNLHVRVEDGLITIARIAARVRLGDGEEEDPRVHAIMVDVTSSDASDQLSAPPPAFLEEEFLSTARVALHEGGVLAMNVMPTGVAVHEAVLDSLASVFEQVYELPVNCDGENFAVFALSTSAAAASSVAALTEGIQLDKVVDATMVARIHRVR